MFITRVLSAIVIVILAGTTIYFGDIVLAGTLLLVALTGFYELSKVTGVHEKGKKINLLELAGYVGTIAYYVVLHFNKTSMALMAVIIGTITLMMAVYVFTFPKYTASNLMNVGFSFLYAPVMLSFVYMTRELPHGIYLVWLVFLSSWISDTFAYLVGITIGKHKYLPKLSPKKSLEGSIGGVLGSAILSALYAHFFLTDIIEQNNLVVIFAVIGAIGSVISQIGDLVASAIKRNFEIKDYGRIIPGHGGIMDRFDSVIFTGPIIFFLAYYLI